MTEWQDIRTAPKDGTEILLFIDGFYPKRVIARWYGPWSNWMVGAFPNDPAREEYHRIGAKVPTHWMPLPEPPKAP